MTGAAVPAHAPSVTESLILSPNPARTDVDTEAMPPIAVAMALMTFTMFAIMDTSGKYLVTAGLSSGFVVWCRFTTQGTLYFLISRGWRNADIWRMRNVPLQILRGLALPTATFLNFEALKTLQLAETVTIFLSTPMIVTALAGPLLGEWAGRRRWAAIMTGFVGVLLVARPGTAMFSPAIVYSLGAALVFSFYSILTRKLATTETQDSLVFYSSLFGVILLAPLAWAQASMPASVFEIVLLCVFGGFGMVGHTLLVKASRIASASKLAPFVYTQLLWMTALGFIVFGDVPDWWTIAGAAIICASGLYLMYRERVLRKERQKLEYAT